MRILTGGKSSVWVHFTRDKNGAKWSFVIVNRGAVQLVRSGRWQATSD
ncbi:hypothetical protein [Falsihalocynthiibacter sp. S25ZX9]